MMRSTVIFALVTLVAGAAPAACDRGGSTPQPSPSTSVSVSPSVVVSTVVVTSPVIVPSSAETTHDCKVLLRKGYTYPQVLQYWIQLGSPADMDDDHDGFPCETVYGDQN